jgi:hypothetical protein
MTLLHGVGWSVGRTVGQSVRLYTIGDGSDYIQQVTEVMLLCVRNIVGICKQIVTLIC